MKSILPKMVFYNVFFYLKGAKMKIIKSILINTLIFLLIFLGVCILYIISKILLSNALNEFLFVRVFVSILVSFGLVNVLVILFIFFKKCLKYHQKRSKNEPNTWKWKNKFRSIKSFS